MKREYSLKGRNLFKEVFRKGKKIQGKGIRIFILEYDDFSKLNLVKRISLDYKNIKVGISFYKNYGNAVIRNKIKRRIRSICAELKSEMNNGFCIIIRPGKDFNSYSYEQLKLNIRSILQQAGVVNQ